MWKDNRPPLPDWIQQAYAIISPHIDDPHDGIPRERAHEILLAHQDFEAGLAGFRPWTPDRG